MEIKEAIKILKASEQERWQNGYDIETAVNMAIEYFMLTYSAMEKQIGREPILFYSQIDDPIGRKYTIAHIKCPNEECDEQFDITGTPPNYCPKCGQKIKCFE